MKFELVAMVSVLAAFATQTVHAQNRAVPERFCGSGDKSQACAIQRDKANTVRAEEELNDLKRKNRESIDRLKAGENEKRRQRTVIEQGCNPRTQRCG